MFPFTATSRQSLRRLLLSVLALALLAGQVAGLAHAADSDAHVGADVCHLCEVGERDHAVAPVLWVAESRIESSFPLPVQPATRPARVDCAGPPPARAPPR